MFLLNEYRRISENPWQFTQNNVKYIKLNTETYRSGHNGADSKSVREQSHVGSNPTVSARKEPRKVLLLFLGSFPISEALFRQHPQIQYFFHTGVANSSRSGVFFWSKWHFTFIVSLRCKEFRKKCSWRDSKEQFHNKPEEWQNAHSFWMLWIAVSHRECYNLLCIAICTYWCFGGTRYGCWQL